MLWALHLSGYFGGVWLRGALDRAQPGTSAVANVHNAPTEGNFRSTVATATKGNDAARAGDDAAVLAYNEASLFADAAAEPGIAGNGLSQGFGYNQGYLLQILEKPPEGLTTPAQY
jgi:hypothetical protein